MTFDEYQLKVRETALYPQFKDKSYRTLYPFLKLGGETGEVLEKVGKQIRDFGADFREPMFRASLAKELGDILWYLSNICTDFNLSLGAVAKVNLEKVLDRKQRDVLHGSGDNR